MREDTVDEEDSGDGAGADASVQSKTKSKPQQPFSPLPTLLSGRDRVAALRAADKNAVSIAATDGKEDEKDEVGCAWRCWRNCNCGG